MVTVAAVSVLSACSLQGVATQVQDGPSSPSEILVAAQEEEWAAVIARFPNATRPEVALVEYSTPDTWNTLMAECMDQEGFTGTVATEDGGLELSSGASAQPEAVAVALFACGVQYPIDPLYRQPLSDEQFGKLYDYYAGELTVCFRQLGLEVSAPPSEQEFRDSYDSNPWSPYDEAFTLAAQEDPELVGTLEERCPQLPPDLW